MFYAKKIFLLQYIFFLNCFFINIAGGNHFVKYFELNQKNSFYPENISELQQILKQAVNLNKKVSIVGANKSQGGQTICPIDNSCRINLEKLNKLFSLDLSKKQVTIEAGATWNDLQQHLKNFNMSVKCMQSYNDFSIGGSISVNVHGQDHNNAPLIQAIKSFKLLLSNGEIIDVSRENNYELFQNVVGGYGLFGIITQVTLEIMPNDYLRKKVVILNSDKLGDYFFENIKNNLNIQFYSARFSLGESNFLDKVLITTFEKTDEKSDLKQNEIKKPKLNFLQQLALTLTKKYQFIKNLRFDLENWLLNSNEITTRNNIMSHSIIYDLPQDDSDSMYILQEYFIPYAKLNTFIEYLKYMLKCYNVNLLNLTARHINKNIESTLSYSINESCALVLYLNIDKDKKVYKNVIEWTRYLIDRTIELGGTFYLPYQLLATKEQVRKAYPKFDGFLKLKKIYDSKEVFVNQLYEMYK